MNQGVPHTVVDPNAASAPDSGVFGLPFTESESRLIYIPVPWEATTSYRGGTSQGPELIFETSKQVDLYDLDVERPYEVGYFFKPADERIKAWNQTAKEAVKNYDTATANDLGQKLNESVYRSTEAVLKAGKIAALVGGDHSTPFGAIEALSKQVKDFGILHFDAHSDTRNAYNGFTWSHASIMYNVLTRIPEVKKLTQVGIRDFCEEEQEFCKSQKSRVQVFYDRDLNRQLLSGKSFLSVAEEVVSTLPENVWISFDIDGLDPKLCPGTGTPVPGGLSYAQASLIIELLARSKRKIIGFDLNEVAGSEWDGIVGARLLYLMSAWTLYSQKLRALTR